MKRASVYPAAQIATAIGVSAARVRQRLSAYFCVVDGVRGLRIEDLPQEWRAKLTKCRTDRGLVSDEEWLEAQQPWQPAIPFVDLRLDIQEIARQRRELLADGLRQWSLCKMSARQIALEIVSRGFAQTIHAPLQWIETAIKNDNDRCEFGRIEIYLPKRLKRAQSTNRPAVGAQGSNGLCDIVTWDYYCEHYFRMQESGVPEQECRREVIRLVRRSALGRGKSYSTLWKKLVRAIKSFAKHGRVVDSRMRERNPRTGRKPKFVLTPDEQNALRHCRLRKDSLPTAIEDFVNEPECRPETREKINAELDAAARARRLPNWPLSLRRAGYITSEEQAHFRGEKHAQQFEFTERRGMWLIDDDGREIEIVGNTLFESDDMSTNEPFRYLDPETTVSGAPAAIRVGRQTLCTMNVYSAAWLGVSPVGRERDAYRLEDIADHLRDIVIEHGLPLYWRFERGPWENQVIDGIKLKDGSQWGSLGALFHIQHVFKSRSKGLIESSFDHLQSLCAHESLTIGRSRGEFERATKLYLAAGRGDAQAASHFWEISAAADGFAGAMERFNHKPKQRRAFGRQVVVPADLQSTAPKRECPPNELWRFSPIKREATVRGGAIECSVPHYPFPFRFRVNGVSDLFLQHGYAVLVAFHPGRPEDGCHVFNAERGARNRDGLKFGELMFVAPIAEDAPQLNLRPDEYEFVRRKNANAAVRSEFRAIVAAGSRGRRVSTARDGYGNSAVRSNVEARAMGPASVDETRSKRGDDLLAEAEREQALLRQVEKLEHEARERGDISYA